MPGRKRLRTAFPALEDTPERHREPRRDRPHRARSTGPHAIRAQAAHVKVAEKTSLAVQIAGADHNRVQVSVVGRIRCSKVELSRWWGPTCGNLATCVLFVRLIRFPTV